MDKPLSRLPLCFASGTMSPEGEKLKPLQTKSAPADKTGLNTMPFPLGRVPDRVKGQFNTPKIHHNRGKVLPPFPPRLVCN